MHLSPGPKEIHTTSRPGTIRLDHAVPTAVTDRARGGSEDPLVVRELLKDVTRFIECDHAVLLMCRSEPSTADLYSSIGLSNEPVSLVDPGILARAFEGAGEVINDMAQDGDIDPVLMEMLAAQQMAIVPLTAGGQRLGAVAAINSPDGAFRAEDLEILATIARQTALRLENTRLHGALERQTRELRALRRLAEIHTGNEGLEAILTTSVRAFAEALACDKVCVLLHDEERDVLLAQRAAVGLKESVLDAVCVPVDDVTIAGAVLRTGAAVVSNDAASDSWVDSYLRESLGIEQVVAVPLVSQGSTTGVLLAIDPARGFFDDEDVELAVNVAGYVAAGLTSGRSHEQDRAMVHQLREIGHTKSDFISMLAHELKGPMTTVLGFSHMLQADSIPQERRSEVLEIISREVSRLSRLVSDLLDLSRMEAGSLNYSFEPVDLAEVMDSILRAHPSLASKHLMTSEISSDLPRVKADPDRLRQALLNLLTNATRYSESGTIVRVDADVIHEPDGPRVCISVKDEGIGISDEDKIKVFSKFVMLEKPNWVTKGTGLGLYITKGIVESHGGRIWVESEPGAGSTFRMTLIPATDQ